MTDFSREWRDSEHLRSNLTQAMRLMRAAGLDDDTFGGLLYEARSIVRQQPGVLNKAAYWFRVVEDLLGMRDDADQRATP